MLNFLRIQQSHLAKIETHGTVIQDIIMKEEIQRERIKKIEEDLNRLNNSTQNINAQKVIELEAKLAQLWQLLTEQSPKTGQPQLTRFGRSIRRRIN